MRSPRSPGRNADDFENPVYHQRSGSLDEEELRCLRVGLHADDLHLLLLRPDILAHRRRRQVCGRARTSGARRHDRTKGTARRLEKPQRSNHAHNKTLKFISRLHQKWLLTKQCFDTNHQRWSAHTNSEHNHSQLLLHIRFPVVVLHGWLPRSRTCSWRLVTRVLK